MQLACIRFVMVQIGEPDWTLDALHTLEEPVPLEEWAPSTFASSFISAEKAR